MFDLKFLKSTGYFEERTIDSGALLFDEGEVDNNFYIIVSGKLSIEKYTSKERKSTKQLAVLADGDFLGEGALNSFAPKEVKVKAAAKTSLLCIDAKKKFGDFLEAYPQNAKDILVYIISITHQRVLESNRYITSIYEINASIRDLSAINFKEIFKILDKINNILDGEFLLFLETNAVMNDYLTLKYDSRKQGKMQDIIVEKGKYSLGEIGIPDDVKILTKEISIGNEVLGSVIVGKKESFNQSERRIFLGMMTSLSGVLKQKKILEEQRDKEFSQA